MTAKKQITIAMVALIFTPLFLLGCDDKDKKTAYAQANQAKAELVKLKAELLGLKAEKAFLKINPDEQLLAMIIATIEQAKTSEDWIKESGKYIPYPATWLNAKGWEDEDIKINKEVINGSYQPPTQFPIDIE